MFKIFIDETPVTITADESYFNRSVLSLRLRYYNPEIVDDIIKHVQEGGSEVVILHHRPADVLTAFTEQLKSIPAAGGIALNARNQLLIIKRKGMWDLPKGKLEKDETAETGAIREVSEECGIKQLSILSPLPGTWHCYSLPNKMAIKHTAWFLMRCDDAADPTPQTEEDIEVCEWVDAEVFYNRMETSYASLRHLVQEAKHTIQAALKA